MITARALRARVARSLPFVSLLWPTSACLPSDLIVGIDRQDDGAAPDAAAGTSPSCVTDADCAVGRLCGYPIAAGCTAIGACYDGQTGPPCDSFVPACACDGTTVKLDCDDLPAGIAARPIVAMGSCDDAALPPGGDAGGVSSGGDAGAHCASDSDCPSGLVCGFLQAAACGAMGSCFPPPQLVPTCTAFLPGCACDGATFNLTCNGGLPNGYGTAPLAYDGECADAGP